MKLLHLLKNTLIVTRMVAYSGSGDKMAYSTVTAVKAHFQAIGADKVQSFGGVYGKTFMIWLDPSEDIQEGDILRDTSGNHYKVKKGGVTRHTYGAMDYKKVILELSN